MLSLMIQFYIYLDQLVFEGLDLLIGTWRNFFFFLFNFIIQLGIFLIHLLFDFWFLAPLCLEIRWDNITLYLHSCYNFLHLIYFFLINRIFLFDCIERWLVSWCHWWSWRFRLRAEASNGGRADANWLILDLLKRRTVRRFWDWENYPCLWIMAFLYLYRLFLNWILQYFS